MKKIDFETHFATQSWVDALYENKGYPRFERDPDTNSLRLVYHPAAREPYGDALIEKLLDLGESRLQRMDAAGVDVAVISLTTPGVEQFEAAQGIKMAREANDILAAAIAAHPDRYQGFAALPIQDTDASVRELERAVKELGLKGWKTHSNYGASYLDDKRYWPVLAKCEELRRARLPAPHRTQHPRLLDLRSGAGGPAVRFRHRHRARHDAPGAERGLRRVPRG